MEIQSILGIELPVFFPFTFRVISTSAFFSPPLPFDFVTLSFFDFDFGFLSISSNSSSSSDLPFSSTASYKITSYSSAAVSLRNTPTSLAGIG